MRRCPGAYDLHVLPNSTTKHNDYRTPYVYFCFIARKSISKIIIPVGYRRGSRRGPFFSFFCSRKFENRAGRKFAQGGGGGGGGVIWALFFGGGASKIWKIAPPPPPTPWAPGGAPKKGKITQFFSGGFRGPPWIQHYWGTYVFF